MTIRIHAPDCEPRLADPCRPASSCRQGPDARLAPRGLRRWGASFATAALLSLGALLATGCSDSDSTEPADGDSSAEGGGAGRDYASEADDTPLGVNPDAVIGELDNGLAYYLLHNDNPGGSVELRLAVNAGALEAPQGSGAAHFLEHMLFNGTESFSGQELDRTLQSLGIELGADSNAYTTYDSTVYLLKAPTRDPEALNTAFQVLAEWASAATLDPAEVAAEIGVVRDEFRQSQESPDGYVYSEFDRIYTEGTVYEGRSVLGAPEAIESTDADSLRSFYDSWYRPDNMAVVAVGDLDVAELETLVNEHFGDLEARGDYHPAPTAVDVEPIAEDRAHQVTHSGNVFDNLSVDFQLSDADFSTVGGARNGLWESLIAAMVTDRLAEAFYAGELEIDFETELTVFSVTEGLRYFGSNLAGPDLSTALRQYLGVVRGAAEGFDDDEIADAVEQYAAALDRAEATVGSLQDFDYADGLVAHFSGGHSIEAPLESIRRQRAMLGEVTADDLSEHLAGILERSGALLIAVGSDSSTLPSSAELLKVAAEAEPTARIEPDAEVDRLVAAPESVDPVAVGTLATAGRPRFWSFANGTTVVFEPSVIAEGTVLIAAQKPGGYSRYESGGAVLTGLAAQAVSGSGLAGLTRGQVIDHLADKAVDVRPFIDRDFDLLSGSSSSVDLETAFALIHLLITQPRIDPTGLNSAVAFGEDLMTAYESRADIQAEIEYLRLLYGGDFANWVPSASHLADADAERLLEVYRKHFGGAEGLVISVVGDAAATEVERLARSYIGTLPAGQAHNFVDRYPAPPADVLTAEVPLPDGAADGGIAITWRLPKRWDTTDAATAVVLQTVVNARIFEEIREQLAASYAGAVIVSTLEQPHSHILAELVVDGDPARLQEIRRALLAELADLAANGPGSDEFDRALAVISENFNYIDNQTLSAQNLVLAADPGSPILTTDNRRRALATVTAERVEQPAAERFDLDAYIEVTRTLG